MEKNSTQEYCRHIKMKTEAAEIAPTASLDDRKDITIDMIDIDMNTRMSRNRTTRSPTNTETNINSQNERSTGSESKPSPELKQKHQKKNTDHIQNIDNNKHQSQAQNSSHDPRQPKMKKRAICERCHRPTPRACICESLPHAPIQLRKTSVVVLQHPLELKHKNRSIPILELCLGKEHLHLCVGRRLGHQIDPKIMTLLQPPNIPILLYPKDASTPASKSTSTGTPSDETRQEVLNLTQALERIKLQEGATSCVASNNLTQEEGQGQGQMKLQHRSACTIPQSSSSPGRIVLLLLDATWRYAREMNQANLLHDQYPNSLVRVSLEPEDLPQGFAPRRFDIRTTPEPSTGIDTATWMCTAECIARVLARVEDNPQIYEIVTRPLDTMVRKWNAFAGGKRGARTKEPRLSKKVKRK